LQKNGVKTLKSYSKVLEKKRHSQRIDDDNVPAEQPDAARKEAFSCSFDKLDSTIALSAKIPGLFA